MKAEVTAHTTERKRSSTLRKLHPDFDAESLANHFDWEFASEFEKDGALYYVFAECSLTVSVLISDGGDRIDPGDEQDREVMTGEFIKFGVSPEQIAIHWKQARRDIEKDLRSPAFE